MEKLFVVLFLLSCLMSCNNAPKTRIDNGSTTNVDTSIATNDSNLYLLSQERDSAGIPTKIISFGPYPKNDTLIANYHIQYQIQDNDERFLTGYSQKNSDTLFFYSGCDVMLNIKLPEGKLFSKKINRDLFQSYIPKEEFPKYTLNYLRIDHVDTLGIFFDLSLCILDTDIGYDFELHVNPAGIFSIKEIYYEEDDDF